MFSAYTLREWGGDSAAPLHRLIRKEYPPKSASENMLKSKEALRSLSAKADIPAQDGALIP